MSVTFESIRNDPEINTYIRRADDSMQALGFTEHAFAHVGRCAEWSGWLLTELGYPERDAELARIAGYMHDIGNVINRADHAQSGALMAFRLLDKRGMDPSEIAHIVTAIGNHDEATAFPVNAVAAALILADKSDVRRTRVRNRDTIRFDIHDRVNYAAEHSALELDKEEKTLTLRLKIDTEICAVMDYFEIFMTRMLLCRKAAEALGLQFKLQINDTVLL